MARSYAGAMTHELWLLRNAASPGGEEFIADQVVHFQVEDKVWMREIWSINSRLNEGRTS